MTDPTDPEPGDTAESYLGRRIVEALDAKGDLAAYLRDTYDGEPEPTPEQRRADALRTVFDQQNQEGDHK